MKKIPTTDDEQMKELLVELLILEGYSLDWEVNRQMALELMKMNSNDVLITDINNKPVKERKKLVKNLLELIKT